MKGALCPNRQAIQRGIMLIRCGKNILILFIFLISYSSFALIGFEDAITPELAPSGRALAMGNAFIAKVDDASAAFYNPAGLGTVRWFHFHINNLHLEMNKGLTDMATGGRFSDAGAELTEMFSLEGHRKLLITDPGNMTHSRFHILPNLTTRFFSLGYLVSRQNRATIGVEPNALFEYAQRTDHGPYMAANISLFGGVIKFGASAIYLNRKEAIGEQDKDETLDLQDGDYKKGQAVIITSGGRITLPIEWLPTFAATVHNSGNVNFKGSAAGAPDKIRQSVDVGFSLTPQIGKTTRVHLEVNLKDVNKKFPEVSSSRKVLAGIEFDFRRYLFIRFGYGDGFGSGGLGIKAKSLEVDLTTYAVDTTSSEFRGKQDRRFVLSLSSGF